MIRDFDAHNEKLEFSSGDSSEVTDAISSEVHYMSDHFVVFKFDDQHIVRKMAYKYPLAKLVGIGINEYRWAFPFEGISSGSVYVHSMGGNSFRVSSSSGYSGNFSLFVPNIDEIADAVSIASKPFSREIWEKMEYR
jgi:hypothetical protein